MEILQIAVSSVYSYLCGFLSYLLAKLLSSTSYFLLVRKILY